MRDRVDGVTEVDQRRVTSSSRRHVAGPGRAVRRRAAGRATARPLARLLSLVERGGDGAREVGRLVAPAGRPAYTVGVTGARAPARAR